MAFVVGDSIEVLGKGNGEIVEVFKETLIGPGYLKVKLAEDWFVGCLLSDIIDGKATRSMTITKAGGCHNATRY